MPHGFGGRWEHIMKINDTQLSMVKDRIRVLQEFGTPLYKDKLAHVCPEDLNIPEDFEALPFTEKSELRDVYPLGNQAVPDSEIVRIHSSSGTTGTPIIIPYTRQDVEDWTAMFARCYEVAGITSRDRIHITPGYGLWTAGIGFQLGCERLGAMAIPMGPGNTDKQLKMMVDMGSTVLCATSSYALLLAEEIEKRGIKDQIKLRKGVIGSERWGDKMRARISAELGVELYDIYGLTEIYGPGIGINCAKDEPMHYWDDYIYLEIIDPKTGKTLPDWGNRRNRYHHTAQTGRTSDPLPYPRPLPDRHRTLLLRTPVPQNRQDHRPQRRHGESQGRKHLSRPDRRRAAGRERRQQRISGNDRPSERQGHHDPVL